MFEGARGEVDGLSGPSGRRAPRSEIVHYVHLVHCERDLARRWRNLERHDDFAGLGIRTHVVVSGGIFAHAGEDAIDGWFQDS